MTVLKELVEHHVKEEEGELFPEVERELPEEKLESLGLAMEKRFDEVLKKGYEAVFPDNFEETTADLAQAEAE